VEAARKLALKYTSQTVEKAISSVLSESDIVEQCIHRLEKELKEDEQLRSSQQEILNGSIILFAYLWDKYAQGSAVIARKCPLVASDNYVVRWSPVRMMMACVVPSR